jgi:hypothetical protein
MKLLVIVGISLVVTFLFDFIMYKVEQKREEDESWKALNEQLEREGKQRWDKKGKDER